MKMSLGLNILQRHTFRVCKRTDANLSDYNKLLLHHQNFSILTILSQRMDGVVDIIRMQLISQQNQLVKDGKIAWKTIFLVYILSNHKLVTQRIQDAITNLIQNMAFYKKCISFEKKPKGIVYLKMDKMNNLFKEMMSKHSLDFGSVRMKSIEEYHPKSSKIIVIDADIYFELYYGEATAALTKDEKKSSRTLDDIFNGRDSDKQEAEKQTLKEDMEVYDNARGRVYSYSKTVKELVEYLQERYRPVIEDTTIAPVDKQRTPNLSNLTVLRLVEITKDNVLKGEKQDFVVSKNLANIFLEEDVHDKLNSHIERFDDRFWYASRGIPRTLGILLHGIPGCGKTSFIKSLCAAQKRPAVIIDFKFIRTIAHLRSIFQGFMELRNGGVFAFDKNKTIYVFEDFDCMSDVFLDREKKEEMDKKKEILKNKALDAMVHLHAGKGGTGKRRGKSEKRLHKKKRETKKDSRFVLSNEPAMSAKRDDKRTRSDKRDDVAKRDDKEEGASASGSEDDDSDDSDIDGMKSMAKWRMQTEEERERRIEKYRKKWEQEEGNTSITLNDFLEIMDGVVEMDGRIIVMTTNCKDKIDKALLRPGRIDIDLELRPPSLPLIAEIFFYMYQDYDEEKLLLIWKKSEKWLKGGKLSTAKVMNCFMFLDPEVGMRDLLRAESPDSGLPTETKSIDSQRTPDIVMDALARVKHRLEQIQGGNTRGDTRGEPVDVAVPIVKLANFVDWTDVCITAKVVSSSKIFPVLACMNMCRSTNYRNLWNSERFEEIEFTCERFKVGLTEFHIVGYDHVPYRWTLYGNAPNTEDLWQKITDDEGEAMSSLLTEVVRSFHPTVYFTKFKLSVMSTFNRLHLSEDSYVNMDIRYLEFHGHAVKTESVRAQDEIHNPLYVGGTVMS